MYALKDMPSEFITALCSNARNERIPEEYDFFGGLIGGWDIVWNDHLEEAEPRRVKGEWIFSRVLDGTASSARPLYRSLSRGTPDR